MILTSGLSDPTTYLYTLPEGVVFVMIGLFVLGIIGAILYMRESRSCPSCGQRSTATVLERKMVEAFQIHFHEGEPPASDAIRSTFASKLDLDENDIFVSGRYHYSWNGTAARVALPKDVLPKKFMSERDPTIWGPEGTGPARGWCARMAQAQERMERRRKRLETTFSELWRPTKKGDAALIRLECKRCKHTWTQLRTYEKGA